MIKAFIFDLDGTLVQTEIMKAHSYALAAMELKPGKIKKHKIIEEYKKLVGRSRQEVAKSLLNKFYLNNEAVKRLDEFKTGEAWEVFVKIRLNYYFEFLNNPRILSTVICPHTTALLKKVKSQNYKTALATTSHNDEASKVLDILKLTDLFDFIATRDLIEKSKPDPEIYDLVLSKLNIFPEECIAIEDSVTGIKSAIAAKINCIAVPNAYTSNSVNNSNLISEKWIINRPELLSNLVNDILTSLK